MRIAVLGPVRVFDGDGTPVGIGGARPRMLLSRLALAAGDLVTPAALIDGLWGTRPPADALNSLHALVYRLRKALPDGELLESSGAGYRLAVPEEHVDAARFEALAARGGRELAAGAPEEAASLLGEALALWRGPALADVREAPFAGPAGDRLEELRNTAFENRCEAELRLGRHAEVLADLEAASADHPLRERLAALRMRALHAAGRQSDALAVFEDVRGRLADELGVDPSPELREAHLAVLRGGAEPPAVRSGPAPGRLPARLTSFVGRDRETALLDRLLGTSRLVTVVGPGGVGKTRLAVEAASRHRAHRQGRLWLVPLAGARGADEVADAVLGTLSTPHAPRPSGDSRTEPLDQVAELLGGGEAVLVLDNCEQAVDAVAAFAQGILERRPRLTVLATSREPLDVMGESLCRLGPLPLPPRGADPAEAAASAAVRLFVDRATAVRPGFTPDASALGAVTEVVRRLDGLPLALELAAARLRSMSAEQIARRLDDRFRLLSTGNRAAQPRQRTLHAVIEWSWELLTGQEQALARRMAVFPATTGAEAVEAVCPGGPLTAGDVPYVLGSLVDKSLVEQAGDGYRMLESVRAYAAERLLRAGEREAVRDRLVRHFADVAGHHEPLLRSARQQDSFALFTAEYDNLVFALRTAVDAGDADAATRLLGPLYWYWNTLRHDARAEALVAGVCELGDALPEDARTAFTAIRLLTGTGGPAPDAERVRALIEECARTGALERYPMLLLVILPTGFLYGLDELVGQLMREVRGRRDRWAVGCTYLVEAFTRHDRGDWAGRASATTAALREFEAAGDPWCTAMALAGTAQVHSVRGDHDQAVAAYRRGLALVPRDEIQYRLGLAAERMRGGDLTSARYDIDTAEQAARDRGDDLLRIGALACRADLHRRAGELHEADRQLDRMAAVGRAACLADEAVADWTVPARMANLLTAGDAVRARELLPRTVQAAFAHRDVAPAAQQLAKLLLAEGDAAGAATALGTSRAIRGAFDEGDPELRELTAELVRRLGRAAYDTAYGRGAATPRQEALDRLRPVADGG
ncbi:BTAD domain-containing putative transcriptional regulator [Streptomyces paromomycinus]|uniref:SARP family transcriptional regulator n=1 Tax=Streptomyces paromomycinus TaxID=92743 RepID=A0A401WE49_STREY|nr:BTAD domain-containing putative transcriptional regulator [Streptomyces paromomycinus]GCD47560.1 SARP family transcriptional regulator [Streptomyces paromomycinus]